MTKMFFQLVKNNDVADLDIYGDIAKRWWDDDATDSSSLSKQLEEIGDVSQINVHINSYGGEVAEGLAIYNALRRHGAKIRTTCDGFACSIASVIFMAGDERVMSDASLLMIHNAWTSAYGVNAADLRKLADDMDTITQASKNAYMSRVNIDEKRLGELMDAESWILPTDAIEMGFATEVEEFEDASAPSQCARRALVGMVAESVAQQQAKDPDDDGPDDPDDTDDDPDGQEDDPEDPDDGESEDGHDDGKQQAATKQPNGLLSFLQAISQ